MSRSVQDIKNDIFDMFREVNADVGHSFNFKWFSQVYMPSLNAKEKENLGVAVNELIDEGFVTYKEQFGFPILNITKAGVDHIY